MSAPEKPAELLVSITCPDQHGIPLTVVAVLSRLIGHRWPGTMVRSGPGITFAIPDDQWRGDDGHVDPPGTPWAEPDPEGRGYRAPSTEAIELAARLRREHSTCTDIDTGGCGLRHLSADDLVEVLDAWHDTAT